MTTDTTKPSSKALAAYLPSPFFVNNQYVAGFYDPQLLPFDNSKKYTYQELIKFCRYFYDNDTIVGTVIDRMVDMSITKLRNRKDKDNLEKYVKFFDAVADYIQPYLKLIAFEYFVHGLVVPELTYDIIMGNKVDDTLGRKRVYFPANFWIRNPEFIELRKRPVGTERSVYLRVPPDEASFIITKGQRSDGSSDPRAYQELKREFPDYIKAVEAGQRLFLLENARPIYRRLRTYEDYPKPYLQNALFALQHKYYLKLMDRSIANRASELLRHVKIGSDKYPATDDDIKSTEVALTQAAVTGDRVFNFFTNHTIEIGWVMPPIEALMSEAKYSEPNADIFLALGFPRILAVGESLRSNSNANKSGSLGPISTLNDMRETIIVWVEKFYQEIAEKNQFEWYPKPFFSPIALQDITALTQLAIQAQQIGAISKDTIAQLYGSTYEDEQDKIDTENQGGMDETNSPTAVPEEQPQPVGGGVPTPNGNQTVQ